MSLPPEIQQRMKLGLEKNRDMEEEKPQEREKRSSEGTTIVPFGTFVRLILKRKVQRLFKEWQNEPVILAPSLLTAIASAPEDTAEDRSKIILTALVIGLCFGFFITAVALVLLGTLGIILGVRELLTGLIVLLAIAAAVFAATKIQVSKRKQEIVEKVERVSEVFSK